MTYDPYKPPAIEPGASAASALPFAPGFRPSHAGLVASVLIGAAVAFGVAETVLYFSGMDQDSIDAWNKLAVPLGNIVRFGGAFAFLFWIHRVVSNARGFGGRRMRQTPARAVGFWFIPFVNLVHGYQVVSEVWQASDPEDAAESSSGPRFTGTTAGFVLHWWLAYIASRIAVLATRLSWTPTAYVLSTLFEIVAAALMMLVIRRLDERQEARARAAYRAAIDPGQ